MHVGHFLMSDIGLLNRFRRVIFKRFHSLLSELSSGFYLGNLWFYTGTNGRLEEIVRKTDQWPHILTLSMNFTIELLLIRGRTTGEP